MMNQEITDLLEYAKWHLGLQDADKTYMANAIAQKLKLTEYVPCWTNVQRIKNLECPDVIMKDFVDYAKETGLISDGEEEFFTTELLDMLTPRPSQVIDKFNTEYKESPEKAFNDFYDMCVKNDYVKLSAIRKNILWVTDETKHPIEITINLSKPEKNNKITAKLKNVSAGYPKCMLCAENVGYEGQGRTRRNMRTLPITLAGEKWFWQYSPYAYFEQHGIAINCEHTPMVLNANTMRKILDFVDYAPQYFIGSNAPLPIVGGSILAHEHFQGGKHLFPMFAAKRGEKYPTFVEGVDMYLPDWYNTVILFTGKDKENLVKVGETVLNRWLDYTDGSVGIISKTDGEPHNTLSPIARKTEDGYELYLMLRNNRCDEENPDGIFHAHKEYHNIKSESIGLIEAMGRFILPGRLNRQLDEVAEFLTGDVTELYDDVTIHKDMIEKLQKEYGTKLSRNKAKAVVKKYVENVCENILDNTAVFKKDAEGERAFRRFLMHCGLKTE